MPLDLAADMHVFFAPDEFGEAVEVEGVVGAIGGIWDRPIGDIDLPGRRAIVETNLLMLPMALVPEPAGLGVTILRTGDRFLIGGEPQLNRDGDVWSCELLPA